MRVIKAHAYGNDFLIAPRATMSADARAPIAKRLCDRHRGLGADGLITLTEHNGRFVTTLTNADGSYAEVSGNGVRCVAAWIAHEHSTRPGASLTIETDAGPKRLTLLDNSGLRFQFKADMGPPADLGEETLDVAGQRVRVIVLRVGNPQCVVLGQATDERLATIASAIAVHPFFPDGTNVELADVQARDRVRILIWERGVGPTESSGTGACAAAVAAAAYGGADHAVDVIAPGGSQRVDWTDETIWLTGWAELVAIADWLDV